MGMRRQRKITAVLTTKGSVRIGSGVPNTRSELPIQRDQLGRPRLPGTSLAGALRAAAARRLPHNAEQLFGGLVDDKAPEGGQEGESGSVGDGDDRKAIEPSRVLVHDAVPDPAHEDDRRPGSAVASEVRPRVGIDRRRLAAKEQVLFDAETLPAGFPFRVALECDPDDVDHVVGALCALAAPDGGIGAGAGAVTISSIKVEAQATGVVAAVAAALQAGGHNAATHLDDSTPAPSAVAASRPGRQPEPKGGWLQLDVAVVLPEPLACRMPRDAAQKRSGQADNLPFPLAEWTPKRGMAWTVGLPASSLKGVLRQRAERACAFLAGEPLPDPWESHGPDPVTRLFGWTPAGRESVGEASRLRVTDLRHPKIVAENDAGSAGPEAVLEHPAVEQRNRVRIDRLSGTTLESAFYNDAVVKEGETLTGTLTLVSGLADRVDGSVPVDPRDAALLAVALRDIAEGLAGVGGSTRSGYGTLRLQGVTACWGHAGVGPDEPSFFNGGPQEGEPRRGDAEPSGATGGEANVEVDPSDGSLTWPEPLATVIEQGWREVTEEL